ncbi:PLXNA [Mytilus coruscus]|uniref:PLXNA n=1 Tax=Mytilus coruscus TaxID=42192 RepID=A0A6J8A2K2_MYTCO|nr:PLXNA [Mytilus coruscus]
MSGFQLYITNTSTIPPDGYLCYEDPYLGLPDITQTIPCNQLGKYVIYYDRIGVDGGSVIYNPRVSLCYVAIYGCEKSFWGSNCDISCAESCIEQHCFPGNGSCILGGCSDQNCLNSYCDKYTSVCTEGCRERRTGKKCNKYNLAFDSSMLFNSNGKEQASLTIDGNKSSCVTIRGFDIWAQVDLKEISIVTEIHLSLRVNTTKEGNHTVHASNASSTWENGAVLYRGESLPTMINVDVICRYIIYVSSIQDQFSDLEVCEIGIVGCPPTNYGPLCSKLCPVYCSGPCDLETGNCTFGCVKGWIGDKCELGPVCKNPNSVNFTTNCSPEIYQVYPTSGPVNGGTLLAISGKYLGNVNDSISVYISGVSCHNITVQTPYTNLTCIIGKNNKTKTTGIFVTVNANNYSDLNTIYFTFKEPKIFKFSPKKGILSGNTTVTIKGQDIGFEGQNRYNIFFCDDVFCIECSESQKTSNLQNPYIKCTTGNTTEPRNMTQLYVVIDDLTILTLNETFQYLPDPTFNISTEIPKVLQSGGALLTIRGEGFNNVGSITVERVDNPCDVPADTSTECETPPRLQNKPNNQTIEVHFDGVTIQVTIEYVDDPTFEMFQGIVLYDRESSIEIKGRKILYVARREDYHINIGLDGICLITDISMDNITCLPPKSVPRTNNTDDNTVHVIVNVIRIKVYIGDLQYKPEKITENGKTFVMVVGILVAGLVVSIFIGMSAVLVLRRKKIKAVNEFKMKIKAKEEMIQKASREGERIANLRGEDGNEYTEPDESVYDEINADEENNTRGNSYLDVHDGYDELGQRSPKNPYNQLQQTRDEIQRRDTKNNDINADDKLQNNKRRNDYLSLFSGYEKPISRNDPHNQFQQESDDKKNEMTNLDNHLMNISSNN